MFRQAIKSFFCIGPAKVNQDETLSTLRFASTTKNIKNRPVINEDTKDALLRQFEKQVKELREQLDKEAEVISKFSLRNNSGLIC